MSWAKYFTFTPDATKAGTADSSNFTIPVAITHADLKTIANGGLVNDGTKDLAFFSDSALTTLLKFKRIKYDAVNGVLWAMVKVATLSHTAGVPFYLGYGNAAIVTDQSDGPNAWDANTKAAYCFGDGVTLDLLDATAGGFDLTNVGSSAAAAGSIHGAVSLDGSTKYLERTASTPLTTYPLTLESVFKPAASVTTSQTTVGLNQTASANLGFDARPRATDAVRCAAGGAGLAPQTANSVLNSTNWHYASCVYNGASDRKMSVDGAAEITSVVSAGTTSTPDNLTVGVYTNNNVRSQKFNGLIGFVRVSNVSRANASWGVATYNAWTASSTFIVQSGPASLGGSAATIITTQPSNVASGAANSPSPVAKATTDGTTIDSGFVGNCVVSIASGTGALSGTLTVACIAGVATFTNVIITGSGAHTLTFTMSGYTPVTSNSFTVSIATQALIFTQPSASVATGGTQAVVAKAYLSDGTTVDTTYVGNATLTMVGPNGSVAGTIGPLACTAGVATFAPVPTADGPGFTYHVAMVGLTAADTTSFTVIGAVVAANQAFVTAMGGDTALFNVHDFRIYADGALTSIPDTIGPVGGRAAGLTCAGSGATISGGKLVIAAASTPDLESAADSRIALRDSFAAPHAVYDLWIAEATGTGPLGGIAANPTSTTTYPYCYLKPAGSTWQMACASDGATPTPTNPPIPNTAGIFVSDSGVAFADGKIRAQVIGHPPYDSAVTDEGNNINWQWNYRPFMAGKQMRRVGRVTNVTAGNPKLVYGRFGSGYGAGKVTWRGQYTGDWKLAQSLAFIAFAKTLGAAVDVVAIPSLVVDGNSLVNSTTQQPGGDMQSPTSGSGTTSFPSYMANKVSGTRGSLVSQGLDVAEVHSFAYGRSGGSIQLSLDRFDMEAGTLGDGTRTGAKVLLFYDVGNALLGGGLTKAQYLTKIIALKAKCDAAGITLVNLLDADRVNYYNVAGWPTIPSALSTVGQDRVDIATAILADPLTYGLGFDVATLTHAQIGHFSAPDCYSTTYFNISANGAFGGGDATHGAPAIYQVIGEGVKAFLDANDTILYPVATLHGHSRIGMRMGLGM
jgi:hypothetical protein